MTVGLRELLLAERHAVLATLSASRAGWPFASIALFALSDSREPLLLLSDLAEHTRNLRADPRASLLVQDGAGAADPQAAARVTILGEVTAISGETEQGPARARYVARHPQALEYLLLADFHLYVLRVREVRFIGGFGDMGWIDAQTFHAELAP